MEHTWHECEEENCFVCEGGLVLCTVCGGAEGSLTTHCCGYALDEYVFSDIFRGILDFKDNKWIIKAVQERKNE